MVHRRIQSNVCVAPMPMRWFVLSAVAVLCTATIAACLTPSAYAEEAVASSFVAGDINGDGSVDNKDLTRLFQYLSDWDVDVVEGNLDTNGDGSVNNKDLTRLFQYLSDWDVDLFGGTPDEPEPEPIVVEVTTEEVDYEADALFTCVVGNAGDRALSYQWQRSTDAVDWEDLQGQVSSTLSVKATSDAAMYQYRCVVSCEGEEPSYSEPKTMRISSDLPELQVAAHVQDRGWLGYVGAGEIAGTTGHELKLEAVKIKLVDGAGSSAIRYRVHSADAGWSSWKSSDEVAGTTGKNLRAEAMTVELTGDFANLYDVYYRVHVANIGWIGWAKNGEIAGSVGLYRAIEAVQVKLTKKGEPFNVGAAHELVKPQLTYCAHVENIGWQDAVAEGTVAGTTGKGLKLEALKVYMPDIYGSANAIAVRAHCSDIGWQGWVGSGEVAGTVGQNRQVECVQINLSGYAASFFDIYYRVHIADYGWLGWAKNGGMAGSTNGVKRMEAIEIKLVPKGEAFDAGGVSYMDLKPVEQTTTIGEQIVEIAKTQLGVPYVYGGQTPNKCFDCSGLTQWCYSQVGISIPRTSGSQKTSGHVVSLSEARVGDILWRDGHVAIYIGGNQYLHAPHTGDVVRIASGITYFTCAVQYW